MDLMGMINSYWAKCKGNPVMCVITIVLLLAVVQNFVMDLGLGDYLSYEGFSNLLDDSPSDGVRASQPLGQNEAQLSVDDLNLNRTPSTCYPQQALKPEDLLPSQESKAIQEFNLAQPIGEGILADVNLLDAGSHIGVNTVGQSLRNANRQLRSDPPNPQVDVSPWMNTTISPDLPRRPLEVGESCGVSA
jgi:hypothetical protein